MRALFQHHELAPDSHTRVNVVVVPPAWNRVTYKPLSQLPRLYNAATSAIPSWLMSPTANADEDHVHVLAPELHTRVPGGNEVPPDACRYMAVLLLPSSRNSTTSALPSPVKSPAPKLIFVQVELAFVHHRAGGANERAPAVDVDRITRISQVLA